MRAKRKLKEDKSSKEAIHKADVEQLSTSVTPTPYEKAVETPATPTPYEEVVEIQSDWLDQQAQLISMLEDKLHRSMVPLSSSIKVLEQGLESEKTTEVAPHVQTLTELNGKIYSNNNRLADILARLQV